MSAGLRSGVLPVHKDPGITSFEVVTRVRRRLGVRRVGHAGTLDPEATGVLPILIGEATKLMPYVVEQDKEYLARIRLGLATDTHDLTGRVLAERPVPPLDRAAVEAACRPFVGRIRQVPPMFSAVHRGGRRLYELARRGVEVEREPREVVVRSIAVEEVAGDTITLRIVCGKGTYVRVLAADLGAALGAGGVVARLVRTRVGPFVLADAVPWPAVAEGPDDALRARIVPPEAALADWRQVRLDPHAAAAFRHGQAVPVVPGPGAGEAGLVRVHEGVGGLIGVGELSAGGRTVRPVRILHADHPGTRRLPV